MLTVGVAVGEAVGLGVGDGVGVGVDGGGGVSDESVQGENCVTPEYSTQLLVVFLLVAPCAFQIVPSFRYIWSVASSCH